MTKSELVKRLEALSDDDFKRVSPYLEADLDAAEDLCEIHAEVEAGRKSRDTEPLVTSEEAFAGARRRLAK